VNASGESLVAGDWGEGEESPQEEFNDRDVADDGVDGTDKDESNSSVCGTAEREHVCCKQWEMPTEVGEDNPSELSGQTIEEVARQMIGH